MLTQDQITQLEPFTKHPRYGKIVEKAIVNWINEDPIKVYTGVISKDGVFKRRPIITGCCLIGSAVLGEKSEDSAEIFVYKTYGLSENEIRSLMYGFDDWDTNRVKITKESFEPYDFGKKIGEIVRPGRMLP
jgi:hypothetical protein